MFSRALLWYKTLTDNIRIYYLIFKSNYYKNVFTKPFFVKMYQIFWKFSTVFSLGLGFCYGIKRANLLLIITLSRTSNTTSSLISHTSGPTSKTYYLNFKTTAEFFKQLFRLKIVNSPVLPLKLRVI